jgi:streptomycin 6-kinase
LHWWHSQGILKMIRPDGSLLIVGRKGLVADKQRVARDFDNKTTDLEQELVEKLYGGARCGIPD